ncbi:uncharacterized protein LOC127010792 [Drosophila biarmipes]|uniref:uncharacterized protein LOC127010792 n=1 Tax=Drosophila biarmipes TaxID=125945 RepID=UPI0021CC57A4|nr:uncharacterized protein LOC127010792 [Drosophila biarmipes]
MGGAVPPMVGADPLPPAGSPSSEPETETAPAPVVAPNPDTPPPPPPCACAAEADDDVDAISGPPAALMDSRPRLVVAIPTPEAVAPAPAAIAPPPPTPPWPLKFESNQANATAAAHGHLALWQVNVEHRAGAALSYRSRTCHASHSSRSCSRHADAPTAHSDELLLLLLLATPGR